MEPLVCTFTPLKRGRYRCNQAPHVVVKKAQLDSVRNRRLNAGRRRPAPLPARPQVPTARIGFYAHSADCPNCRMYVRVHHEDLNTCPYCRKDFRIARDLPAVTIWAHETHVDCPRCYRLIAVDNKNGKHACPRCGGSFTLTRL